MVLYKDCCFQSASSFNSAQAPLDLFSRNSWFRLLPKQNWESWFLCLLSPIPPSNREVNRDRSVPRIWEYRSLKTWGDLWVGMVRWPGSDRGWRRETILFNVGATWISPGLGGVSENHPLFCFVFGCILIIAVYHVSRNTKGLIKYCWLSSGMWL